MWYSYHTVGRVEARSCPVISDSKPVCQYGVQLTSAVGEGYLKNGIFVHRTQRQTTNPLSYILLYIYHLHKTYTSIPD